MSPFGGGASAELILNFNGTSTQVLVGLSIGGSPCCHSSGAQADRRQVDPLTLSSENVLSGISTLEYGGFVWLSPQVP